MELITLLPVVAIGAFFAGGLTYAAFAAFGELSRSMDEAIADFGGGDDDE